MDDPISRQAAIDALMVAINDVGILDGDDIRVVFDNLPSAQPTQEIIRCKDCRFWKKYKYFNGKPTYAPFCGFNSIFTDDNDFAVGQKRKENR